MQWQLQRLESCRCVRARGGQELYRALSRGLGEKAWPLGHDEQEYEAAGFPLLPTLIGDEATRRRILGWILLLLPITLVPVFTSGLGIVYAFAASGLGAWFVWAGIRLYRERSDAEARRFFRTSLVYLSGLFAAMILDLGLTLGAAA